MEKRLEFSVVVCTRNRVNCLKKCIISLLSQSYLPKEIIIVDDASRDELNVYEFFKDEISKIKFIMIGSFKSLSIILLRNRHQSGIVKSRNTGIKTASGDILAFLDDDCFADAHWIEKLASAYKRKTMGVGGPVVEIGREMKTAKSKVKRMAYIRNGKVIARFRISSQEDSKWLPRSKVPFLQGGNMSFRKSVLIIVNGGDANLKGNCYREETDLSLKISKRGELMFEPEAITFHTSAMTGGSRDIIKFGLDRFLYYMFRNTTYFFFKNFGIKKATKFTIKAMKKQIKLLMKRKTGLTRDYLKIKSKKNSILSVILGTASGIFSWAYYCLRRNPHFVHSKIKSSQRFVLEPIDNFMVLKELSSGELDERLK